MKAIRIFFLCFITVVWSCNRDVLENVNSISEETISIEIVPLEKALQKLEEFLAGTNMHPSKSGDAWNCSDIQMKLGW